MRKLNEVFINLNKLIFIIFILLLPAKADTFGNYKKISKNEVERIINQLNKKDAYIKTANIAGKAKYLLPLGKKIKLHKTYKIQRDSKLHMNIYFFKVIKVAEFVSDGAHVEYKRIRKKPKKRDAFKFNLSIFSKHLDLEVTIDELNRVLLGLNFSEFKDGSYIYEINGNELSIEQDEITTTIDLVSEQIVRIASKDNRKIQITYSNFIPITIKDAGEIQLPLTIRLSTPNFSMKINHEDDIIINRKIKKEQFLIN